MHSLLAALGAPLTADVATHLYLAILTDTGSFHFSHMTPRTFDIAARCVEAGANPEWIARTHYDSNSMGRVRLFGAVLSAMTVDASGRIATLAITPAIAAAAGGTYDDTEGLINFPLSVQEVQAVAFFKETPTPGDWRVSLRSKGAVDVGAIAKARGGGGHRNAAGCGARGTLERGAARDPRRARGRRGHGAGAGVTTSSRRRPGRRQALRTDLARRGRRWPGGRSARGSVTPAPSTRWPAACCRWSSAAPPGWRSS